MRSKLIALLIVGGVGVWACHAEVATTTTTPTPPPPASSPAPVVSAEPPPPPQPVAVRAARIEGTRVHLPHELDFEVNKATFDDNKEPNKEILATLKEFLEKNVHVTKMRIEGHTDNTGDKGKNLKLSQERADAVVKWLVGHGIDAGRLKTVGLGDTKPEVANDSDAHRGQNRRTEFHVEEMDGKAHVPHASVTVTAHPVGSAAPAASK